MTDAPPIVPANHPRDHLVAGVVALAVLTAAAIGGDLWAHAVEREAFVSLLPIIAESKNHGQGDPTNVNYLEHLKNQGTVLQRQAFERPDQLPLYGSSELVRKIPDKASLFFRTYPTGFSVFPVGRAGTGSLLFLQKIASLGGVTNQQRVAISLSPSWFFTERPLERPYLGNFSRQQALGAFLNPRFTYTFRRDLARRFLSHPATWEADPLLAFLTKHLSRGGWVEHASYAAVWPLAQLEQAIYTGQDHFETVLYLKEQPPRHLTRPALVKSQSLDWDRLVAEAAAEPDSAAEEDEPDTNPTYLAKIGGEREFRDCLEHAPEWADLELLVRGLHEMGVNALILCMPPNGPYYEHGGISKEALAQFSDRVHEVAGRWGAEVETFEDHADDASFLAGHGDHLSARGWMYYNRTLDVFYHTAPANDRGVAKGHRKHPHSTARNA